MPATDSIWRAMRTIIFFIGLTPVSTLVAILGNRGSQHRFGVERIYQENARFGNHKRGSRGVRIKAICDWKLQVDERTELDASGAAMVERRSIGSVACQINFADSSFSWPLLPHS